MLPEIPSGSRPDHLKLEARLTTRRRRRASWLTALSCRHVPTSFPRAVSLVPVTGYVRRTGYFGSSPINSPPSATPRPGVLRAEHTSGTSGTLAGPPLAASSRARRTHPPTHGH